MKSSVALVALLALWAGAAPAQTLFGATITEGQVANGDGPGGTTGSAGSGSARFAFDPATNLLHYTISWADLEGDLTKLHVHGPALPGENEPNHLIEIYNSLGEVPVGMERTGSVSGSLLIDGAATVCGEEAGTPGDPASSTLPCLREGRAYVNVHTTVDPTGEIRGNIAQRPDVIAWHFDHSEDRVHNGPEPDGSTDSAGGGYGSFRYVVSTGTLHYTVTWADLEGDLTKLHVHGPAPPGSNNPNHLIEIYNSLGEVPVGMERSGSVSGQLALPFPATECAEEAGTPGSPASSTLPCLLDGRAYVNVHTTVFPMGEVRGDAAPQPPLQVWSFPISEDQVKNGTEPDGSTDSPATGVGTFRFDMDGGLLSYRITWDGLEGDLTKLHVHGPAPPGSNNPNHLIEIYNSVGEVPPGDERQGEATGQLALPLTATECEEEAGTPGSPAASTLPCLLAGRAYVNVHTTVDPMGEIRGDAALLPHPYAWSFPISEDQVKNGTEPDGSTDSPGAGAGFLLYDAPTQALRYAIGWGGLEGGLTKLHIHGPAGSTESNPNHLVEFFNTVGEIEDAGLDRFADVLFGTVQLDRGAAACTGDPAPSVGTAAPGALPCFLEERAYVNVHTEVDPTGEIRGNLRLPEPAGAWVCALAALAYLRRRASA